MIVDDALATPRARASSAIYLFYDMILMTLFILYVFWSIFLYSISFIEAVPLYLFNKWIFESQEFSYQI